MQSPNFNFKLDVRCDEIEAGNFQYDSSGNSDAGRHDDEDEEEAIEEELEVEAR